MRILFISVLLFSILITPAQPSKKYFVEQDSSIKAIQVIKSRYSPSIVAVIAVVQSDWWERLAVVKLKNDKIVWEATFDSLPTEQSIRSVRQVRLKGFTNFFFQVYGQTHRGNGFYYLYELQGKRMILKATTKAVDRNQDGEYTIEGDGKYYDRVFTNDTLTTRYRDINHDGIDDIQLEGHIEVLYNGKKVRSLPAKKTLIYNKRLQTFVEDKTKRKGFEKDDD